MHSDMVGLINEYASSSTEHVASADCSTSSHDRGSGADLCDYYKLSYYPYIIYGSSGSKQGEYQGSRTQSAMSSFIKSHFASEYEAVESPVCNTDVEV